MFPLSPTEELATRVTARDTLEIPVIRVSSVRSSNPYSYLAATHYRLVIGKRGQVKAECVRGLTSQSRWASRSQAKAERLAEQRADEIPGAIIYDVAPGYVSTREAIRLLACLPA